MTPRALLDLCVDAVERFQRGEVSAAEPFVRLVLTRSTKPSGRSIRLLGRHGPTGRLDIVRVLPDGQYECVTLFPALPILRMLANMVR